MIKIWEAKDIEDIKSQIKDDGHLVSIINMFKAWTIKPVILDQLRELAEKRGIDLEHPYTNEIEQKPDDGIPERLKVLYEDYKEESLTDRIVTAGKTDLDSLFNNSNILRERELKHHPFLVFEDGVMFMKIVVVKNANGLLEYSDETKVMIQWKGKWSSDFFTFVVGDLKEFLKNNNITIDQLIEEKEEKDLLKKQKKRKRRTHPNDLGFGV